MKPLSERLQDFLEHLKLMVQQVLQKAKHPVVLWADNCLLMFVCIVVRIIIKRIIPKEQKFKQKSIIIYLVTYILVQLVMKLSLIICEFEKVY